MVKIDIMNTEVISAWLALPAPCRSHLIEKKEEGARYNPDTIEFYHYTREVSSYLLCLYHAGYLTTVQKMLIYDLITGTGDENE